MITETGKFFSVPCERPQKWGPPFWKWQLPQTKLLGITDTRLYNDVSFGTFRAKGLFCYHRELTTLFNWLKWVCQLRYFQYRTTTTKTTTTNPYWLQQWRTCIGFFNGKDQTWSDQMRSDQSLSRQLFATPWITAGQASLSITNSRSSLRLTSIESVMPSSHLILCRPLLLLAPIPPSIWVFSNESTLHMRWPKYWTFSFSIIASKEIPGPISFRMDWLDLLAVQGTLKSLLQHRSSKASILRHSAFFSPTLTSIHDHRKNHNLD